MVKRFHEKAGKYQKTACAAVSIFVFLCIWQMAVAFTKAGLVLAGDADSILYGDYKAHRHPYNRRPHSMEPVPCAYWICIRFTGRYGVRDSDGVVSAGFGFFPSDL